MAKSKVEKDRELVAERREAINRQWKSHPRAESHFTVPVTNQSGDEKVIEVDAVDQVVTINTHGVAVLDSDACLRLIKHLQESFQVVA